MGKQQDRIGQDTIGQETGSEQCRLPTLPKVPYLTLPKVQVVCSFVLLCVCARLCRYVFPVLLRVGE